MVESYEGLASKAPTHASKAVYRQLCEESKMNIEELTSLQSSLECLDRARVQRLKLLANLEL